MAHTALYGGTVYEKKGGADLVGGTVYKKDHGKVLVGGTAYEVGFAEMVTVKIDRGNYYYNDSYVTIDGQTYTGKNMGTTISVPIGTVIYCNCHASAKNSEKGDITLNGVSVESTVTGAMNLYYEYEHTVNGNMTISFDYSEGDESYIRITEVPVGYAEVKITGTGSVNHVYLSVDGVKYYTTQTIVLPIGQTIYLFTRQNDSGANGYIKLNGSEVRRDNNGSGVEYNHTLNGDVNVYLLFSKGGGYITITET